MWIQFSSRSIWARFSNLEANYRTRESPATGTRAHNNSNRPRPRHCRINWTNSANWWKTSSSSKKICKMNVTTSMFLMNMIRMTMMKVSCIRRCRRRSNRAPSTPNWTQLALSEVAEATAALWVMLAVQRTSLTNLIETWSTMARTNYNVMTQWILSCTAGPMMKQTIRTTTMSMRLRAKAPARTIGSPTTDSSCSFSSKSYSNKGNSRRASASWRRRWGGANSKWINRIHQHKWMRQVALRP